MAAGISRAAVPAMETSIIDDAGSAEHPTPAAGEAGE
jgi:hypothetical protein